MDLFNLFIPEKEKIINCIPKKTKYTTEWTELVDALDSNRTIKEGAKQKWKHNSPIYKSTKDNLVKATFSMPKIDKSSSSA